MANEFTKIPNPDNTPGAVSTGYQQQNTNIFCLQTGLDTTEPFDNDDGTITIPAGGIVEVNGSLFKLTNTVTITKQPLPALVNWLAVLDNGNGTATITAVTAPGIWNPAKQGCYRTDGARTLNFVSDGYLGSTPSQIYSKATKGNASIRLSKGWYYFSLGSGLSSGTPGTGQSGAGGAGGGGGTSFSSNQKMKTIFIEKDTKLTIHVGGSGFDGGNGASGIGSTAGGGGGAAGPGEATTIIELGLDTGEQKPNNGGSGGNANGALYGGGGGGGETGGPGGTSSTSGGVSGQNGKSCLGGSYEKTGGAGGNSGNGGLGGIAGQSSVGGNGTNGGGGGMGSHGKFRPNNDPAAGYCTIYKLEN
jgi:hypothetical protein